jgi:hypothetical protein
MQAMCLITALCLSCTAHMWGCARRAICLEICPGPTRRARTSVSAGPCARPCARGPSRICSRTARPGGWRTQWRSSRILSETAWIPNCSWRFLPRRPSGTRSRRWSRPAPSKGLSSSSGGSPSTSNTRSATTSWPWTPASSPPRAWKYTPSPHCHCWPL